MQLSELTGYDLGERMLSYEPRDAILYALAVGARAEELDLVYERDLRVLPTFACGLGLWAVEKAGDLGAYDRKRSLHVAQGLLMRGALPPAGRIASRGRVAAVWDKGKATIVEVEVSSDLFVLTYSIFLPGVGNWGGSPGPETAKLPGAQRGHAIACATSRELAALYRLTGDLHPIHIDPEVAGANGFERPILHGLCTLGMAARALAGAAGAHPVELKSLSARLSAPVFPGDTIEVYGSRLDGGALAFEAVVGGKVVLKDGHASYGSKLSN